jgi:hypothetical protein
MPPSNEASAPSPAASSSGAGVVCARKVSCAQNRIAQTVKKDEMKVEALDISGGSKEKSGLAWWRARQ